MNSLWEGWGVCYPPRKAWSSLSVAQVRRAWRGMPKKDSTRDRRGIYVHIPYEAAALGKRFAGERNPYLDRLVREADLLQVPADLPFETIYVGSHGHGTFAEFSSDQISDLLTWLRGRFSLRRLKQISVEADLSEITEAKARALAAGGVDRVSATVPALAGRKGRALAFSRGAFLLRAAGISTLDIDLALGRPGQSLKDISQEIDLLIGLEPESTHLQDYVVTGSPFDPELRESMRRLARKRVRQRPGDAAHMNRQLLVSNRLRGSILGLGAGAVSHARSAMIYDKPDALSDYMTSFSDGKSLRLRGSRLSETRERRAYLIGALEETGCVDRMAFEKAFGLPPEKAFPSQFRRMLSAGWAKRRANRFLCRPGADARSDTCARLFFEPRYA